MKTERSFIFVKEKGILHRVVLKDILYVKGAADYVEITLSGRRFVSNNTMQGIEKILPPDLFIRVHNSFVIQIEKIARIEDSTIYLDDETSIPVSRSRYQELINEINLLTKL